MSDRPKRDVFVVELPPRADRIARAIDDELRSHLEERVSELVANGTRKETAWAQALGEFGDVESARRDLRRIDERSARRTNASEMALELGSDLWRTVRSLIRRPAFSATAIVTLALGIGANAVMFGLVDRLLLSPPPHLERPNELVHLVYDMADNDGGRITWDATSYPVYRSLADRVASFASTAGYVPLRLGFANGPAAEEVNALAVTRSYFETLGPRPSAGRFFAATETDATDSRTVVISHTLWSRHFSADAAAIGRSVRLGGRPFTIVGVAPRGFTGDGIDPIDAWVLLIDGTPTLPAEWSTRQNVRSVSVVARLRRGASVARASTEASVVFRASLAETQSQDPTAIVRLRDMIPGKNGNGHLVPEVRVTVWLQGVSMLVLLIAIANVTNLLLLRAVDRQRETAVRLALGISRLRLLRHLALESLVLATAGGLAAILLARWVGPWLWRVVLPGTTAVEVTQGRLVTATALIALISASLTTLLPAFLQRATHVADLLRGARGATRRTSSIGEGLVVLQVALTVVLIVGAGLFVRSLLRVSRLDLGFAAGNVVAIRVNLRGAGQDSASAAAMLDATRRSVEAVAGVRGVALGQTAPFRPSLNLPVFLRGTADLPGVGPERLGYPTFFAVSPEYFDVMGISLLRGRAFTAADQRGSGPVMVVDATTARTFWPGSDALGQCVQLGADTMPCTTVIGVVRDTRRAVAGENHSLRYFLPLAQSPIRSSERYVFARTTRPATSMELAIRSAVMAALASAPFVEVVALERLMDPQTRQWRLGTAAFLAFAVLATLVATIGLYGIVSFGVARRERELGVRRALGAPRATLIGFVLAGALSRSTMGLVSGGILSFVLAQRIRDLLFRPTAADALAYGVAVAIVIAAAVVASVGPAWRAIHADPMRALRSD
jgi:predicted permease